jgi:hypothetical protein
MKKHSSLLCTLMNYECKFFITLALGVNGIKNIFGRKYPYEISLSVCPVTNSEYIQTGLTLERAIVVDIIR